MIEMVNGYVCRNCTDVDTAKKGQDPSDPSGAKAAQKAAAGSDASAPSRDPAVSFGGNLQSLNASQDGGTSTDGSSGGQLSQGPSSPGNRVDVTA